MTRKKRPAGSTPHTMVMTTQSATREAAEHPNSVRNARRVRILIAASLVWSVWALCVALATVAVLLDFYTPPVPARRGPNFEVFAAVPLLVYPTVGAFLVSHRPKNPVGWILCGMGLFFEIGAFAGAYADYALSANPSSVPGGILMLWVTEWVGVLVFPSAVLLVLLFPHGRLVARGWRAAVWMAVVGGVLWALWWATWAQSNYFYPSIDNPFGIGGALGDAITVLGALGATAVFCSCLASVLSMFVRLDNAQGEERQQIKWFAYAAAVLVGDFFFVVLPAQEIAGPDAAFVFIMIGLLGIPLAVGVAILKYRLYDIDRIINRTLVYGLLTACIVGLYVLVVGGASVLFQGSDNLLISLLATGLVALFFHPLRVRLQRSVNRLMYGQRDDPYAVLSRLGRRLESTLAPEAALSTIVETVVQALKLPYAAIELNQDNGFKRVAEYGSPVGEPITLPLVHQGEEVGRLVVCPRASGETFAPSDRKLLEDLAWQAGTAAHAVRLSSDLQRSRERLVTAREEERRRLRRDLHDGVGPQLAALMLELETAGDLVSDNPEASALMDKLSERTRETVADVRRSVHALRPPALDELGLVGALREVAAQYSRKDLDVLVEAPEELPPLPAAAEVACYRIAQEAMTNAVRHAQADNCWVRIALDEQADVLRLEVEDDVRDIRQNDKAGVGMSSMRERAEELGGSCTVGLSAASGTLVNAVLPCRTVNDTDRKEE